MTTLEEYVLEVIEEKAHVICYSRLWLLYSESPWRHTLSLLLFVSSACLLVAAPAGSSHIFKINISFFSRDTCRDRNFYGTECWLLSRSLTVYETHLGTYSHRTFIEYIRRWHRLGVEGRKEDGWVVK